MEELLEHKKYILITYTPTDPPSKYGDEKELCIEEYSYAKFSKRQVEVEIPNQKCLQFGVMKLLQFHDNVRPAYYGTYSKKSQVIGPRRPFARDQGLLDYQLDSDEEWEEGEDLEEMGESDEEEQEVEGEEEDGFEVPDGYLSADEMEGGEGDEEGISKKELRKLTVRENMNGTFEVIPFLLGPVFDIPANDMSFDVLLDATMEVFVPLPLKPPTVFQS